MKIFDSMIFFGICLLIAGIFFSWNAYNISQNCDAGKDGIDALIKCPSLGPPWSLMGFYVLPGIILLSSAIFFKKKNK